MISLDYEFDGTSFQYPISTTDFRIVLKELGIEEKDCLSEFEEDEQETIKDFFEKEALEYFNECLAEYKDPHNYYGVSKNEF